MSTRHRFLWTALLACAANVLPAQDSASVVGPNARFKKLFDAGFFLESPAVAPDGAVYFSDVTYSSTSGMQAGHIWKYDPKTGATVLFRSPSGMSNGINFDARGDMLIAEGADFGSRMLVRTDMKTGKSYIAAGLFIGRPFNAPNDLTIDRRGRVFFTDPRYLGHESIDQPVMGVYRLDTDGSVHLIAANVWKPNGIALSPDEQKLYVVSVGDYGTDLLTRTPPRGFEPSQVHTYDLLADGTVKYEKPLLTLAAGTWGDGMTVDRAGNIYVAVTGTKDKNGVYVFSSGGERIAFLATPEPAINVDFGVGATANMLYVACEHGLYEMQLRQSAPHAFAP